jgi:4-alpha-glucanotransferase
MESIRRSGVLLHITSLPGRFGIGSLNQSAYEWVDFLEQTRQTLWQVLPLGPTGYGDSPYQSFSSFAGNPYLISWSSWCSGIARLEVLDQAPLPARTCRFWRDLQLEVAAAAQCRGRICTASQRSAQGGILPVLR